MWRKRSRNKRPLVVQQAATGCATSGHWLCNKRPLVAQQVSMTQMDVAQKVRVIWDTSIWHLGFMSAWAPELLFEASRPTHCLINESGSFWMLEGASKPVRIDALAGKWNVFVPHSRPEWVDARLDFVSTGICLVHDSYRPGWREEGAFGSPQLPLSIKSLELDCTNHTLCLVDGDFVLGKAVPSSGLMGLKDRSVLHRCLCETFCLLGYEMVVEQRRRRNHVNSIQYVHPSNRLVAMAANRAVGTRVSMKCEMMGATAVRIEAEWAEPPGRAASAKLGVMKMSPAIQDWLDEGHIGHSIFPKGTESVVELMSTGLCGSPSEAAEPSYAQVVMNMLSLLGALQEPSPAAKRHEQGPHSARSTIYESFQ